MQNKILSSKWFIPLVSVLVCLSIPAFWQVYLTFTYNDLITKEIASFKIEQFFKFSKEVKISVSRNSAYLEKPALSDFISELKGESLNYSHASLDKKTCTVNFDDRAANFSFYPFLGGFQGKFWKQVSPQDRIFWTLNHELAHCELALFNDAESFKVSPLFMIRYWTASSFDKLRMDEAYADSRAAINSYLRFKHPNMLYSILSVEDARTAEQLEIAGKEATQPNSHYSSQALMAIAHIVEYNPSVLSKENAPQMAMWAVSQGLMEQDRMFGDYSKDWIFESQKLALTLTGKPLSQLQDKY